MNQEETKEEIIDISPEEEQQLIETIKENEIISISEMVAYIPMCRKTFYNRKLHKLHSLKNAIDDNKIKLKSDLRKIMKDSKNATSIIALYKLVGTNDEVDRLNGAKRIHEGTIGMELPKKPMEFKLIGFEDDEE